MTEKQRIMQVMKMYKTYFKNVKGVDVAFSTKGEYFFYEYNEEYCNYSTFVKFSTAEELERIIVENVATEYCLNMQSLAEEILQIFDEHVVTEIDTTNILQEVPDWNPSILKDAFVEFSEAVNKANKNLIPFEKWLKELRGKSIKNDMLDD